jgi:hypothetical protein
MGLKPLDMQTNISQMHEVGKHEHVKSGAIAEQQMLREKESTEKSRLNNTRLDDSKKGEKTSIKENLPDERGTRDGKDKDEGASDDQEAREGLKDDRMGRIIDFRR